MKLVKILSGFYFIAVLLFYPLPSNAQDIGLESVAPLVGSGFVIDPQEYTVFAGISTNMGELTDRFELYPNLLFVYSDNLHWYQFSIDTKYFLRHTGGLYIGAGISVNRYHIDNADSEFDPGLALATGFEYFSGNTIWMLQIKIDILKDLQMIGLGTGIYFDIYH